MNACFKLADQIGLLSNPILMISYKRYLYEISNMIFYVIKFFLSFGIQIYWLTFLSNIDY